MSHREVAGHRRPGHHLGRPRLEPAAAQTLLGARWRRALFKANPCQESPGTPGLSHFGVAIVDFVPQFKVTVR
jgi:hypothetical protein